MSRQNHSDSTNGHPRKSRRRGATQASATHEHPLSQGTPSRPLLGALPLARLIPQDVHSMLDYANGAATTGLAFGTDCPRARAASLALGTSYTAVSLLTDYRLSVAKVIPIPTRRWTTPGARPRSPHRSCSATGRPRRGWRWRTRSQVHRPSSARW
jgi:hypothetical protein